MNEEKNSNNQQTLPNSTQAPSNQSTVANQNAVGMTVSNVAPVNTAQSNVQPQGVQGTTPAANAEAQVTPTQGDASIQESEQPNAKKGIIKNPNAFNSAEQVLFKKEAEKESNPIMVLIIMAIILATCYFLPNISSFVNKKFGSPDIYVPSVPDPEPEQKDDEIHDFNDSRVEVKIDDLQFINFVKVYDKGVYELSFSMINNGEETFIFNKKYYIVFFDDEKEIYRSLIYSYEALGANSATEISVPINERVHEIANKFKIITMEESEYDDVKIEKVEDQYEILTCNYNNNEIIYYFQNNLLQKVKETYSLTLGDFDYDTKKYEYEQLNQEMNSIEGMSSSFIEDESKFNVINDIELSKIEIATLQKLQRYRYFKYNESSRVVSYEIKALGYTCG